MDRSRSFSNSELLVELLKDPDRKSLFRILLEVLKLAILYKTIPGYYFSRYLFKKHRMNIENYLPNKFLYNLKSRFNEKEVQEVVENKLYFDIFYRQFDFPLPFIVMYNHRHSFVIENKNHAIRSAEEFKRMLVYVVNTKLSGNPVFVKKMYRSYGGEKIYKITAQDIQKNQDWINELYQEVITSGYVFQETVKQHPELERFNPSCLNTLRIDTFINKEGSAEVISSYFKTNIKNHYIDNDRAGGCEIPVDLHTGKLKKYGFLTLKKNGLAMPTQHPVTEVQFEGFQIPYLDEAKQLVLQAASFMPGLRLMGWDVAIGPSGPVLIEGNSDYDISSSDLSYGGYKANPVFQKVLQEIGYL